MRKTKLDPFDEKYACCREWWLSLPTKQLEREYWLVDKIFGTFVCPICGRSWYKDLDSGEMMLSEEDENEPNT